MHQERVEHNEIGIVWLCYVSIGNDIGGYHACEQGEYQCDEREFYFYEEAKTHSSSSTDIMFTKNCDEKHKQYKFSYRCRPCL